MEIRGTYGMKEGAGTIRPETLIPLPGPWQQPTAAEIAIALNLAGLSGMAFSRHIGVDGRTVRRWLEGKPIPYAAWAWLAARAGLAELWQAAPSLPGGAGGFSFALEEIEGTAGWRLILYERGQEVATKDFLPADDQDDGAYSRALAEGAAWMEFRSQ